MNKLFRPTIAMLFVACTLTACGADNSGDDQSVHHSGPVPSACTNKVYACTITDPTGAKVNQAENDMDCYHGAVVTPIEWHNGAGGTGTSSVTKAIVTCT